ncbi:MAG: hypothetical protein UT16_C0010G0007 [Candidatus Azambacteria bacterium GW2011_GWA2_39_10]|uniref:DUF2283 domain-containing protein n=1 Tax=Candidatus Azambacteria bacterium GW2011_GWA2_39_10 TaxID=1618611 RepID=A0A0G0P1F2_9BACT|nr:MAG: hypothetical protein UT16_C0010G0007 [Candidatus Azambacteria bacterium GW2011_GWA2_39_10]
MKNKNKVKISYEPEADVLMWEITNKPINFAKEVGNVIVHFTKNNMPVLIEVLEASKFLAKAKNLVEKGEISVRKFAVINSR